MLIILIDQQRSSSRLSLSRKKQSFDLSEELHILEGIENQLNEVEIDDKVLDDHKDEPQPTHVATSPKMKARSVEESKQQKIKSQLPSVSVVDDHSDFEMDFLVEQILNLLDEHLGKGSHVLRTQRRFKG